MITVQNDHTTINKKDSARRWAWLPSGSMDTTGNYGGIEAQSASTSHGTMTWHSIPAGGRVTYMPRESAKHNQSEEAKDWERLAIEEFMRGYADVDAVYDEL